MEVTPPLITRIVTADFRVKPTVHVVVHAETESGSLVLKLSARAAHELRAVLENLPPNFSSESPVTKR